MPGRRSWQIQLYRLIKFGGARRVLFLVDRSNLGEQAEKGYRPGAPRASAERLVGPRRRRYHEDMIVAQLLKRAKTLPKKQLVRGILALILDKRSRENAPLGRRPARVTWPDVEARAKLIVGDRVLPNLVLLERGGATQNRLRSLERS